MAPQLITRRASGQLPSTSPPPTWREPTEKSAAPSSTGAATAGTDSGSCCRSASITSTTACRAIPMPSTTADERPEPSWRRRTCARTAYPSFCSAATAASVSTVPCPESSSTSSSSASSFAARSALKSRVVSGFTLSASS